MNRTAVWNACSGEAWYEPNGVLRRARDGAHQRDQLVDRDRQRALVAVDVVGRRVADQQHLDT
jgi:hypothetical protein